MPREEIGIGRRPVGIAEQVRAHTGGHLQAVIDLPVVLYAHRPGEGRELGGRVVRIEAWNSAAEADAIGPARLEIGERIEIEIAERILQEQVEDVDIGVAENRLHIVVAEIE